MQQNRLPKNRVTPEYEDAGLFKDELCQVRVDLVPTIDQNARKDFMVKAFVRGNLEIGVLFAGRRAADATPLLKQLQGLRKTHFEICAKRGEQPSLDGIRLPVQVEGCWRRLILEDETGWGTRHYRLVAARWAVLNSDGKHRVYGAPPLLRGPVVPPAGQYPLPKA